VASVVEPLTNETFPLASTFTTLPKKPVSRVLLILYYIIPKQVFSMFIVHCCSWMAFTKDGTIFLASTDW